MTENIKEWIDEVVIGGSLPNNKGKVIAIHEPQVRETKFGNRKVCQVVIEGSDKTIVNVQLFLPAQFPMVHPKSNLAKILKKYGCTGFREMLGKEVEVEEVSEMIWKFKVE